MDTYLMIYFTAEGNYHSSQFVKKVFDAISKATRFIDDTESDAYSFSLYKIGKRNVDLIITLSIDD